MELVRLGPLEQAILRALLQAEAMGSAHPTPALWCCLPRYKTTLPNVQAAVAEGAPLRRYLDVANGHFALRDREELLTSLARERWRGDRHWEESSGPVRGLARLPYVEGIALSGSMAWGRSPEPGEFIDLVVLAEGGRMAQASRVIGLYLRSRPVARRLLRVVELIDSDHLERPDGGEARALALLTLRPVVSESGFVALWSANPWLLEHFPNFRAGALSLSGLTDPYMGEREDGTLATLRRRAVDASDGEAVGVMTTSRRRSGLLGRLEETIRGRSPLLPGPESQAGLSAALSTQVAERWEELGGWEWPQEQRPEPATEPTPEAQGGTGVSTAESSSVAEPEASDPAAQPGEAGPEPALDVSPVGEFKPSLGRTKAVAASEVGQRGRGSGRKKAGRRAPRGLVAGKRRRRTAR